MRPIESIEVIPGDDGVVFLGRMSRKCALGLATSRFANMTAERRVRNSHRQVRRQDVVEVVPIVVVEMRAAEVPRYFTYLGTSRKVPYLPWRREFHYQPGQRAELGASVIAISSFPPLSVVPSILGFPCYPSRG